MVNSIQDIYYSTLLPLGTSITPSNLINTQDNNYSTDWMGINTLDTNYSTKEMVINTLDTNYYIIEC